MPLRSRSAPRRVVRGRLHESRARYPRRPPSPRWVAAIPRAVSCRRHSTAACGRPDSKPAIYRRCRLPGRARSLLRKLQTCPFHSNDKRCTARRARIPPRLPRICRRRWRVGWGPLPSPAAGRRCPPSAESGRRRFGISEKPPILRPAAGMDGMGHPKDRLLNAGSIGSFPENLPDSARQTAKGDLAPVRRPDGIVGFPASESQLGATPASEVEHPYVGAPVGAFFGVGNARLIGRNPRRRRDYAGLSRGPDGFAALRIHPCELHAPAGDCQSVPAFRYRRVGP